ncbi:MAG: DMT family transporter [Bacteroidota bacterium]|nr:DMT family transporter [Bacteroidota bacterium]
MPFLYFLLALLAGMMMPTQAAINHKLSTYVHSPVTSAFISFGIGLIALFVYMLITSVPLQNIMHIRNAPPIAWMGGVCGAFFVTAVVFIVPRLGVALTFSILILGQMLATLPIDHFGFLDTPVKEFNIPRMIGVLLVVGGVMMIRRF